MEQEHEHKWKTERTGGMHFSAGEVWDDIREIEVCQICGKEKDEINQESEK